MINAMFVAVSLAAVAAIYFIARWRLAARCPYCSAQDLIRHDPPSGRLQDYCYECRKCRRLFTVDAASGSSRS